MDSDKALVRQLFAVMAERDMTQLEVAERSGISQATLSRWGSALEAGEPIPLRPTNRARIRQFLARMDTDSADRATVLARQIVADIFEELAQAFRSEAQAPTDDVLPPTVRRLLGGEAASGSDADAERQAARLERMAAQQEEMRERRRQERRTGER